MKPAHLAVAILAAAASGMAAAQPVDVPRSDASCAIVSPPPGSKGKGSNLGFFYQYPESVAPNYSGCFHIWVAEEDNTDEWRLKMSTHFVDGVPRIYVERVQEKGGGTGDIQLSCRYDTGGAVLSEQQYQVGKGSKVATCPSAEKLAKSARP